MFISLFPSRQSHYDNLLNHIEYCFWSFNSHKYKRIAIKNKRIYILYIFIFVIKNNVFYLKCEHHEYLFIYKSIV